MDFKNMIDTEKELDITTSSESWKQRIIKYLYEQPGFSADIEDVLTATDPRFTGENLSKRTHCLASQLTYMRQDLGVETHRPDAGVVALLGVRNKAGKVNPFVKPTPTPTPKQK